MPFKCACLAATYLLVLPVIDRFFTGSRLTQVQTAAPRQKMPVWHVRDGEVNVETSSLSQLLPLESNGHSQFAGVTNLNASLTALHGVLQLRSISTLAVFWAEYQVSQN
jgi:hypothetical protein